MREKLTLDQILNASGNGVIATDASGFIVFANAQIIRFLGLDSTRVLGAKVDDVLPVSGPLVMESLRTGEAQLGRLISRENGSLVLNITLILEDGEIRGTVCSFQKMEQLELSARKLKSYKSLNKQLNAIFHSSSDGIWVCDGQGRVTNINEASEKLNGIEADDVVDKNVSDIMAGGLFDRSVTLEVLETGRQVSAVQHIKGQ